MSCTGDGREKEAQAVEKAMCREKRTSGTSRETEQSSPMIDARDDALPRRGALVVAERESSLAAPEKSTE